MELKYYWEILWRRKWLFLSAVVVVPLFALILMVIASPIYQSQAKLWIRVNSIQQKFVKDLPLGMARLGFVDQGNVMGTIAEILKSGPVIGAVIAEMELKGKDGEVLESDGFINPGIMTLIGQKKGVEIEQLPNSETFAITGYSDELSEAEEIAERVIENFLNVFYRIYREEAEKASNILELRLHEIDNKVLELEEALAGYKARNNLFNITYQANTLTSEISDLESELNRTKKSLQANKSSLSAIKEALKEGQMFVKDNEVIQDSRGQLLALEIQMAAMLSERTPDHPEIKALKNQVEAVKDFIDSEVKKAMAHKVMPRNPYYDSLITKYRDTEIEIVKGLATKTVLAEQIAAKKRVLVALPKKERQLNRMSKELKTLRFIYDSYLSNLETAMTAKKMDLANAVVIQKPIPSENPSENLHFPPEGKGTPTVVSTIVGTFFGLFIVFFLEYLDDSILDPGDIQDTLNLKVLWTVPNISTKARKEELSINNMATSSFTDSVHNLLVSMRLVKGDELGKVVSIVSPARGGEGKTTLTAFTGAVLAGQGKKTLLVDANLRVPAIHRAFGLSNTKGLSDYLKDGLNVEETTSSTSISNLDIMPAGSASLLHPQSYFDSDRFEELLKALRQKYDTIITDTPAFECGSDALIISKHADDVLFVVEHGKTPRKKAIGFIEAMSMANIKVLGVVLNKLKG